MVDRERILAKLDELEGYVRELRQVAPESFAEYMQKVENRRACERLLQISIECIIDICGLFVSGLRLGLPAEEDDNLREIGTGNAALTKCGGYGEVDEGVSKYPGA